MAYEKQSWVDQQTVINASRMRHIEDGIEAVGAASEGLSARFDAIDGLTDAAVYIYVDGATGNDATGDGSTGKKFKTIQRAVDSIPKIINKDRLIRVQEGVYNEDVYIRGIAGANVAIQKAGTAPANTTAPTGLSVRSIEALDLSGRLLLEWVDMVNTETIGSATTAPLRFSRCQYVSVKSCRFTSNTKAPQMPSIDFDGSVGTVNGCYFNDQYMAVLVQNGSQVKVYDSNTHGGTKSTYGVQAAAATISKNGDLAWARTGCVTPESRSRGGMINDDVWQSWTPTLSAAGSMTFTGTSVSHARYTVVGRTCHYVLRVAGTTGGTASTSLQYSLPVPAYLNSNASIGPAIINDAGFDLGWQILADANTVQVRKYGTNNPWSLGTDRRFYVSGTYEIA